MIVHSGAPAKRGGLALSFSASGSDRERSAPDGSYTAAIIDQDGSEVLVFNLPAQLVEPIVLARCRMEIFISLSGEVSIDVENAPIGERSTERPRLDELVARAVEPEMLQDEPEAGELLNSLRQKLELAIGAVDAALSTIAKR